MYSVHTSRVAAAASVLFCLPSIVHAFDTGPHNDITRNVLENYGYSRDAQVLSAISNWFTDAYAFSPDLPHITGKVTPAHIADLEEQHCNNLYSIVYGANYISQHVVNTQAAVRDAIAKADTMRFLAVLGLSLHTYQDFYAHSNWATLHLRQDCTCYGVEQTFFSDLVANGGSVAAMLDKKPELVGWMTYEWLGREYPNFNTQGGTITHGDYCDGINSDSYIRPHFEETFSYALAASLEWVYNVEKWAAAADPTNATLNAAKAWAAPNATASSQLYANLDHAFEVSYSATQAVFGEANGHWKGEGSGSIGTFAESSVSFATSDTPYTDQFLRATDPIYTHVTQPSLYTYLNTSTSQGGDVVENTPILMLAVAAFTPYDQLPNSVTDLVAVVVRTKKFTISDSQTGHFSDPDPWAQVTIGGFEIREAPMRNQKSFMPYWTAIKWVPRTAGPQTISYQLIDAGSTSKLEQNIPISGNAAGTLDVNFDITSKVVSGGNLTTAVYSNYTNTVVSTSPDGTTVEVYFDARPLRCAGDTLGGVSRENVTTHKAYITFCPNSAYGEMGVFGGCDGSRWAALGVEGSATGLRPKCWLAGLTLAIVALMA
ncbi:hypothetical protein HKX48_008199 [Thoreauomyces humboldtii]|nr:hypothetical protein HKX48_008199 [Thoreauomyces humboldtii]